MPRQLTITASIILASLGLMLAPAARAEGKHHTGCLSECSPRFGIV